MAASSGPPSTGDAGQEIRHRRRDRHDRGLRGPLVPPGVPLHRSRAERFEDLVLRAAAELEPRWDAELANVDFAVEEIPPRPAADTDSEPVPLARIDLLGPAADGLPLQSAGLAGDEGTLTGTRARIVVYRRPLLARADGDDELAELVLDVVVEQVARLLGVDPQTVDPEYPDED